MLSSLLWILVPTFSLVMTGPTTQTRAGWTVYSNAKVYTADPDSDPQWSKHPFESIGIYDGIIECIGSNDEVEACVESRSGKVTHFDLKNQYTILPGLHDVHQHPLESSNDVGGLCQLPFDKLPDSPEMISELEKCSIKTPKGTKWYLGHGHSILNILEYLKDESKPDPKKLLDGLFFDSEGNELPALMLEATSHSVWVNSAALKEAGITKDSPDPPGGIILRNSKGEPNGILLENAGNIVLDMAFDINKYPELGQFAEDALRYALETLSKNGITSIVDARTFWMRKDDLAWDNIHANGELTVRAILALWAYPELDDEHQIAELKSRYENPSSGLLRKSMIKFYSDGLLEAYTAALLQPYLQDIYDGLIPENKGINYFNQSRLTQYLTELQNLDGQGQGFDFLIHTIGDAAVRQALNAIEDTQEDGHETRHRLTHLELAHEDDLPRFRELGVIADPQVSGDWALFESSEHQELENIIGQERADRFIPVNDLKTAGATVTLSSDWDVSDVNPFVGIQHAIQRGSQAVDLQSAVEMYTINSAFAMRQENVTGSLTVGKEADLVIIDQDIFNIQQDQIEKTVVLQTVLQGGEVWRHKKFDL